MSWLDQVMAKESSDALGLALLHSVWLIALVAFACGLALVCLPANAARVRYACGWASLGASLAMPMLALGLLLRVGEETLPSPSATPLAAERASGAPDVVPRTAGDYILSSHCTLVTADHPLGSVFTVGSLDPSLMCQPGSEIGTCAVAQGAEATPSTADDMQTAPHEPGNTLPPPANWRGRVLPLLVGAWVTGMVMLMGRILIGLIATERMRQGGVTAVPPRLERVFARWRDQLRMPLRTRIAQSSRVSVPCAIGVLRPLVLMPTTATANLTHDQLEAVVAHELAHIRRHDFLINSLQSCVTAVLFYHPLVWWMSRQVCKEREHCCDDEAVALCGEVANLASALGVVGSHHQAAAALALAGGDGGALCRIKRLMGKPIPRPAIARVSAAGIALSALAVATSMLASPPPQLGTTAPHAAAAAFEGVALQLFRPGGHGPLMKVMPDGRSEFLLFRGLGTPAAQELYRSEARLSDEQRQQLTRLLESIDHLQGHQRARHEWLHSARLSVGQNGRAAHRWLEPRLERGAVRPLLEFMERLIDSECRRLPQLPWEPYSKSVPITMHAAD